MKITDVHLTLFGWDDIPATRYGIHTGTFSGASQLGLVTIETDDGVTHAPYDRSDSGTDSRTGRRACQSASDRSTSPSWHRTGATAPIPATGCYDSPEFAR